MVSSTLTLVNESKMHSDKIRFFTLLKSDGSIFKINFAWT